MNEILDDISGIIISYESGEWSSVESLRILLRKLTSNIYYLTKYNIEYHEKHNAVQYKHKGSVSGGLILANEQFPELRMIRKIMEAANNVKSSMIMELSNHKKRNELNTIELMDLKEKTKNTYFNGYFYHEVHRYFKNINGCFNLFGDGVFNYTDVIIQDSFDKNGNYLGQFEAKERYTKKENGKRLHTNWGESVIQIDYNFHKIKYGASTMDEVGAYEGILSNSNLINSPGWASNEYRFNHNEIQHYYEHDRTYRTYSDYEPFEMIEICYAGFSQRILNTTNKKLYDLSIKDYTKRKNDFIKSNPDLKERTENIYMHNIVYLMRFWKVTKKQLLSNRKKTLDLTINKLNRKITNKTKQL